MNRSYYKDIIDVFNSQEAGCFNKLLDLADRCRRDILGDEVYPRGLLEFSNICECNCFYCGLRRDNRGLDRYQMGRREIVELALRAYQQGIKSIALQSGEVATDKQVDFLAGVVRDIKESTAADGTPGMGITLSVGELDRGQYQRLWEAGAHRYLLRIESSNPVIFKTIHPPNQSYKKRLLCLDYLREIGYQVGTGVMVGLPGQTYSDLANDLFFFQQQDIDMLGMGPYIPNSDAPLFRLRSSDIKDAFITTVKMMAMARILMPDINMVASTALQTIHPDGLRMGLRAGANVVMPVLTPEQHRHEYALYQNKSCKPVQELQDEIKEAGFQMVLDKWGDSLHYHRRRGTA